MRFRVLSLLIILLITIPVLAQDDSEALSGEAFVNSITIEETEDGFTIEISGDLADACTELDEITQTVEDETIFVSIPTTRPVDAVCAMVLVSFEAEYDLDISEIEPGDYTLDINGITEDITIPASGDSEAVELTCPEADEDSVLYEENTICFIYPLEFEELSGNNFILVSQPLTANAVLLVEIEDAEDITLDDLREDFENDEIEVDSIEIAGEDALLIETDTTRTAYVIANEQVYIFFVQPLDDEDNLAESLWTMVIESVFFPEPEAE